MKSSEFGKLVIENQLLQETIENLSREIDSLSIKNQQFLKELK